MSAPDPSDISLDHMRRALFSAVVCDALDALGFSRQSPGVPLSPRTADTVLVGRCKTTLWEDVDGVDEKPYEKELAAVDSCRPDDVLIAAAAGSERSGVWGELLSTAARNRGCVGAVVDGAVRDVRQMSAMGFPVFARSTSVYDSRNRQRVADRDVPVAIDGVLFNPGDIVFADADGVVVVPRAVEVEAIRAAWRKVHDEDAMRAAIAGGMKASEAYRKYGIL